MSDRVPPALPYAELPVSLRGGMQRYIEEGVIPGGFLCTLLKGRLFEAAVHADPDNLLQLGRIAVWITHHAPAASYGSYDSVMKWHERFSFALKHS